MSLDCQRDPSPSDSRAPRLTEPGTVTAPIGAAAFLRRKIGHMTGGELVRSQVEALLLGLVGGVPGAPGLVLRRLVYKVLFKRLAGAVWVEPRVTFVHTDRLSVGTHFGVNSGSYINAVGGITVGDYVVVGTNVTISSGEHPIEGREPPIYTRLPVPKPIVIEDDVWIGAGAVIMPGVTLRRGTVVGANSVVTSSTEEYSVVVGVPARKIRSR
jgi:acetyltransferase-like isoleucine patch superfamily enzyme